MKKPPIPSKLPRQPWEEPEHLVKRRELELAPYRGRLLESVDENERLGLMPPIED